MPSIYEVGNLHTMVTYNKRQSIPHSQSQLYMFCRGSFSYKYFLSLKSFSPFQIEAKMKSCTLMTLITSCLFSSPFIISFSKLNFNEEMHVDQQQPYLFLIWIVRALETVIHHLYDSVKCIYSQFKCQKYIVLCVLAGVFPNFKQYKGVH